VTPAALALLAEKAVARHGLLRPGQAAMTALIEVDQPLAERINGTLSDPYFDDDNLPRFWLAVTEAALDPEPEQEVA
jgi:hypothetical protein